MEYDFFSAEKVFSADLNEHLLKLVQRRVILEAGGRGGERTHLQYLQAERSANLAIKDIDVTLTQRRK